MGLRPMRASRERYHYGFESPEEFLIANWEAVRPIGGVNQILERGSQGTNEGLLELDDTDPTCLSIVGWA
jgi:hypothetical protein